METKLRESKKYSGIYRGIHFEIKHHDYIDGFRPDGTWCYYLYINEKQLQDDYKKDFILKPRFDDEGRVSHDYYSTPIADFEFHGGITYYSKEGGADGEPIVIKIGCDYAHLGDEGRTYNEKYILMDVQCSINALYSAYPDIKIFSNLYGGYFKESEGEYNEHGSFSAFEEQEKWKLDRA